MKPRVTEKRATEKDDAATPTILVLLPAIVGTTPASADQPLQVAEFESVYGLKGVSSPVAASLEIPNGDLSALCRTVAEQHPHHALLIKPQATVLPSRFMERLWAILKAEPEIAAITTLGSADPRLDPFAGLKRPADAAFDPDSLVAAAAERQWFEDNRWPAGAVYLPAATVETVAAADIQSAEFPDWCQLNHRLLAVAESIYCDAAPRPAVGADAEPLLPALAGIRDTLQRWLKGGVVNQPFLQDGRPITLHITHGWGGGVARWIDDYAQTENRSHHLILASANYRTGDRHSLSLHLGTQREPSLMAWPLQPDITDSTIGHAGYRAIINDIIHRYAVDRIVVSSLIGHDLDALNTGLPTLQVLHDYYPCWPLLSTDPGHYRRKDGSVDLSRALRETEQPPFADHRALYWERLRQKWLTTLKRRRIPLVAPSQSVIDNLTWLADPSLAEQTTVVPHGIAPLDKKPAAVGARARPDKRLRLVLLGRISAGKGKSLLADALRHGLADYAQIYLLGSGKDGEAFFGQTGVNVVYQYQREQLPSLLRETGPHAGLLLSTVPETFSYTLSELQMLGIPAIATRRGSFSERLADGRDGYLIEPRWKDLLALVKELHQDPAPLAAMRQALAKRTHRPLSEMVRAYREIVPPAFDDRSPDNDSLDDDGTGRLLSTRLAYQFSRYEKWRSNAALDSARQKINLQQRELEKRTAWATRLEQEIETGKTAVKNLQSEAQALNDELLKRTEWALSLDERILELNQSIRHEQQQLQEHQAAIQTQQTTIQARERTIQKRERTIQEREQTIQEREHTIQKRDQTIAQQESHLAYQNQVIIELEAQRAIQHEEIIHLQHHKHRLDQVIASRSWRLTKPLRLLSRLARNAKTAQVYSPRRWPYLFNRLKHSLAARGWKRTLWRLQAAGEPEVTVSELPLIDIPEIVSTLEPESQPEPQAEVKTTDEAAPEVLESFSLPTSIRPKASLIIPVYNQYQHTQTCLKSLANTVTRVPYEVIVVDDASDDCTPRLLAGMNGITTLTNPKNLGFIGACNRGAGEANAEFLVFLNNDTAVTDYWLDRLLETFSRFPNTGIAGARLLFPDGSLQEVGGIIFRDGSGWNYGRGQDPADPRFQYARKADYVSGACLAVPKALFQQLGGFDDHYAPAYYEDTDLAFKCRDAGFEVRVQPQSTVIHFEGATSGTDISAGTKRYQQINQEKFIDRWTEILADHPDVIDDPANQIAGEAAANHGRRGRLLVIDAYTPQPDQDSGSVRLVNLMMCLQELGYQVTFLADNRAYAGHYTSNLQAAGIEVLYHPWVDDLLDFFEQRGPGFDAVMVSRHYVAEKYLRYVRHYCPNTRFVFDTVDLHYLRELRLAELEGKAALKRMALHTKRAELNLVHQSDATLVVSPYEQSILAGELPEANVQVVSNIHPVHGCQVPFEQRRDIFFVGGYQHPPNVDAATWFAESVFPLIRAQLPNIKCYLVGSKAPEEIKKLHGDGIVFKGFVEDLGPFLNRCRLSVAPLRYGAGVKGKVNMSMSYGQPVVATSIAVEGMYAEDGTHILVADEAQDYADAVVRLYTDAALWQKVSKAGLTNVTEHFSFDAAKRALSQLFESLEPVPENETPENENPENKAAENQTATTASEDQPADPAHS